VEGSGVSPSADGADDFPLQRLGQMSVQNLAEAAKRPGTGTPASPHRSFPFKCAAQAVRVWPRTADMRLRRERHEAGRHEGELEAGCVSLASKRWSDDESGIAAIQRRSRAQVNWAPSRIKWFEVMRECGDEVRELLHDGCPAACRRCALLPRQCFHFARQRGLLSLAPDLIATTSVVAQAVCSAGTVEVSSMFLRAFVWNRCLAW
jgi:hypothetical protein